MREILFRGKNKQGEWVYGNYCEAECLEGDGIEHLIIEIPRNGCSVHIIPETVGQYTGLKANGKKIFEGDILQVITGSGWTCPKGTKVYYEVVFTEFNPENASWSEYIGYMAKMESGALRSLDSVIRRYGAVVVGNIHDNPELLEGGEQ